MILLVLAAALLLPLGGAGAGAAVLGADDRNAPGAFLSAAQEARFDGVGRIECLDPASRGVSYIATGWVVGAADTVITAAHAFYKLPHAGRPGRRVIDPAGCIFVLFNSDQTVREIANIRYAVSPWADGRLRYDSSYDVAVLKLARPLRVATVLAVRAGGNPTRAPIRLVAFQTGVPEVQRLRATHGIAGSFPAGQLRDGADGPRISNAARLFTSSASSSAGSSGGLYYDERAQAAVGLHVGSLCEPERAADGYDPQSCFNYGLRFDAAMVALIGATARDEAPGAAIVRPSETRLAMLDGDIR